MRLLLFLIILFCSLISFGQSAYIKRVGNQDKAHLVIGIKEGDSINWYFAGCSFKDVTLLPDTIKLRLISELLNYTSDTAISDYSVSNLCGRYTTIKKEPSKKKYNLQIDALILINYIAFSSNACFYSPYPLLYDKENNTEIFHTGKEVDAVVAIYKDWFSELKQKGLRNYCYPLFNKKYEWFESKVKQQKFIAPPLWDSVYDCKGF